ncbi:hypothetical protein FQA39_LY14216 [Lamprigera yunnana]|nr:hypothetical protein FQA39_LY14216 [Lamprigera yunnana]
MLTISYLIFDVDWNCVTNGVTYWNFWENDVVTFIGKFEEDKSVFFTVIRLETWVSKKRSADSGLSEATVHVITTLGSVNLGMFLRIIGVNEATVHLAKTLGAGKLEYFLWRVVGKVNCSYGSTAPNVSGLHKR